MNEIITQPRKGTLMTYSQEIKITVAHKFLQQEIDRDLAYEQDCNDLASQGFAPEFCKHGTYLWVDYDVMCPYCEDPDPEDRYSRSLRRADEALQELEYRLELQNQLVAHDAPYEAVQALNEWITDPLPWRNSHR